MAGNKQHHVWQMLQRGFGEKRGKDHHVWVYRKAKPAKQTVTRLFGVEKHFYGPEGSAADAKITKYENDNQSIIQDIRKLPNGTEVDPEFASILISHLEIRSAFLRQEASNKLQKMAASLVHNFKSPEKLRAMMLEYLEENPAELDKLMGKGFVPIIQRTGVAEIMPQMLKKMSDEEVMESIGPVFDQMDFLTDQIPELMKSGQNDAFVRDIASEVRAKFHLDRHYSVYRPQLGTLILPDTTLAFVKKEGASPFFQKDHDVEAVILPVASDAAIIGRATDKGEFSLKAMNRLLAACSFEAFLAKDQSPHFQGLTGRIGKYAKLISDGDLRKTTKE